MTPKKTLYGYIKNHIEILGENLKGSTPNNSLQQELLMIKRLLERYDEQYKKQEKILDILKKKDFHYDKLIKTKNFINYNEDMEKMLGENNYDIETDYLTEEEYDLLKEWLND